MAETGEVLCSSPFLTVARALLVASSTAALGERRLAALPSGAAPPIILPRGDRVHPEPRRC